MENKALERYLRRLKGALTCARPDRERLLSQGRQLLADFLGENPEGGYEAMAAAFGPPEAFAEEMLSTLDQEALKQARARRKLLRRGAALLAAAVLVLCAVFYAVKWYQAREIINGDFRIVQDDDFTGLTKEEFYAIFGRYPNSTGGTEP